MSLDLLEFEYTNWTDYVKLFDDAYWVKIPVQNLKVGQLILVNDFLVTCKVLIVCDVDSSDTMTHMDVSLNGKFMITRSHMNNTIINVWSKSLM